MKIKLIDRAYRLVWYLLSRIVRIITPTKNNRVIMWAYSFRKYTCHPQHFSAYLLNNHPGDFEIIWALENPKSHNIDCGVKVVKYPSLQYLWYLYTSKFIISNSRCKKYLNFFKRKENQEYIQTWHDSGVALKRIEKDAFSSLGIYVRDAILDSKNCTLMLSASDFQTSLIKKSFWYEGEILKKGLPRNDCFVNSNINEIKDIVRKYYNLKGDSKILLYAPTFRNDSSEKEIFINFWDDINKALGDVTVLVRLHPNSIKNIDVKTLLTKDNVIDATSYSDMQELLIATDYLITDYSSCMIDMALLTKPCFLYTPDLKSYDRGSYFELEELPFPLSVTKDELINSIINFNKQIYINKVENFMKNIVGFYEIGEACQALYEWMINKNEI